VKQALLDIGAEQQEILGLFSAQKFIESDNDNYESILQVARELDIVR